MSQFGNLGGNAGGATTSAQTGLFGSRLNPSAATSGPSGPGIFAPSQPTSTAGGGLSGATLLGSLRANAAPAASSQPANTGSAPAGGSFVASTQQTQQTQQQQAGPQGAQANGAKPSQAAYFDHLLERGKKRANEHDSSPRLDDLPRLQLGLGDIARRVRFLGDEGPSAAQGRSAGDTKAHYLLAASGVNTASTLRDLNNFTTQAGVGVGSQQASRVEAHDTDLDSYVASLRNQSTLDLIAEGLEQSKRDFDTFLEETVQLEWEKQRRRIYEHFGLTRKEDALDDDTDAGAVQDDAGAFGRRSRRARGLGKSSLAGTMGLGASGLARSVIGAPKAGNGRASVFGDAGEQGVAAGGPIAGGDDRFQRDRSTKLAEEVKRLNAARGSKHSFPVLRKFAAVEADSGIESVQSLVDSYNALMLITDEKPDSTSYNDPSTMKERYYRDLYADIEEPNNANGLKLRRRIIQGSRKFLEKQFHDNLNSTVNKNPREAQLGGVPTVIDKIRGYVRILAARKELGSDNVALQQIKEDYCFVIIYVLIRCGLLDDAKKYVQENQRAFQHIDRNFARYITAYAESGGGERQFGPDLQQRIQTEFLSLTKIAPERNADPYRVACYKIMGRCELGRRSLDGVGGSWEDWVWLQFALAREQNLAETPAKDVFGLKELREMVEDIGNRHFQAGANSDIGGYGTYFFLQVLVGRWEHAVSWLYQHDLVAAVHFAIALDYYGLLRVADFSALQELLTFSTKQWPQLHFGLMIGYYTAPFRTARPLDAVEYLTLIAMNADLQGEIGKQQKQLCHEALRELVLETREFAALLGDIRIDGQVIPGSISLRGGLLHLESDDEFLRIITMQAAGMAEEAGRVTDAVLLFHLARQYDAVITIISRALSEAISVELGSEPMKLEPLKPAVQQSEPQERDGRPVETITLSLTSIEDPTDLARTLASWYSKDQVKLNAIKEVNRDSCGLLIRISEARQTIEQGRWKQGCGMVANLNLLPLNFSGERPTSAAANAGPAAAPSDNMPLIRERASILSSLPPPLANTIPSLLLMTLTALSRWRFELQSSPFTDGDATRQATLQMLGDAARDLMVYAGLVRYKLPGRVFEKLSEVVGEEGG